MNKAHQVRPGLRPVLPILQALPAIKNKKNPSTSQAFRALIPAELIKKIPAASQPQGRRFAILTIPLDLSFLLNDKPAIPLYLLFSLLR
jgi:hypothetical protein